MVPTVTFLKVDIADNEALSKVEKVEVNKKAGYQNQEVPTFILYKNGQLLSRVKDYSGLKVQFSGASGLDLMSLIEVANDHFHFS